MCPPIHENYYRDKRTRTGKVGEALRERATRAVDSGEVAFDWNTAPFHVKRRLEDRLALFAGQIPDDPLERARYLEGEQQRLTRVAEDRKGPPAGREGPGQGAETPPKGPPAARRPATEDGAGGAGRRGAEEGGGGGQEKSTESGAGGASRGIPRSQFVMGDPNRGFTRESWAQQSVEVRMALEEGSEEPLFRMGDITGFFDAGGRQPEGTPEWMRETYNRLLDPVEGAVKRGFQFVGGTVEGLQNTAHTMDLAWHGLKRGISGLDEFEQAYFDIINSPEYDPTARYSFGHLVERPGTMGGALVRTLGQFLPLFLGATGAMRAAGMRGTSFGAHLSRDVAAGAVADFAVFDAMEGNLHTMMRQLGTVEIGGREVNLENAYTAYMDSSEGGTHLEGKLKNVLEGALLGAGVTIAFEGGRLVAKGGKMTVDQARELSEAIVRSARATREMRRAKWKGVEEEALGELQEAGRERLSEVSSFPTPSSAELRGLSKLAAAKIAQGSIRVEEFVTEWGKKRGFGVNAAAEAWDAGEQLLAERGGKVGPFFSRLEREALKLQGKSPEQHRKTLANSPEIKAEEMEYTGLDDWLEEKQRLGESVTREDVLDYLERSPFRIETELYGRVEGKTGYEILVDEDPLGVNNMTPARVEMGSEDELFERYVADRVREKAAKAPDTARDLALRPVMKRTKEEVDALFPHGRAIRDKGNEIIGALETGVAPQWADEFLMMEAAQSARQMLGIGGRQVSELTDAVKRDLGIEAAFKYRDLYEQRAREAALENVDLKAEAEQIVKNFEAQVRADYSKDDFGIDVLSPEGSNSGILIAREGPTREYFLAPNDQVAQALEMVKEGADIRDALRTAGGDFEPYISLEDAMGGMYERYAKDAGIEDIPKRRGKFGSFQVDPLSDTYEEAAFRWKSDPHFETVQRRWKMAQEAEDELAAKGVDADTDEAYRKKASLAVEAQAKYGEKPRRRYDFGSTMHHYGEEVLSHNRASVELSIDGKTVRYNIEEVQSDWLAQDFTKTGRFHDPAALERISKEIDDLENARSGFYKRLRSDIEEGVDQVGGDPLPDEGTFRRELTTLPDGTETDRLGATMGGDMVDVAAARDEGWESALKEMVLDGGIGMAPSKEAAVLFARRYGDDLRRKVRSGSPLQRPEGIPRHNESWRILHDIANDLYERANTMVEAEPDMFTAGRRIKELTRESMRLGKSVPRAPMAEKWHEMNVRHAIHRAVDFHAADEITSVPSSWQVYNWGTNAISWMRTADGKVKVAYMPRYRQEFSPHKMEDDTPGIMLSLLKQDPGEGARQFSPTEDSALRFEKRYEVFDIDPNMPREDLESYLYGRMTDGHDRQREQWASRLADRILEGGEGTYAPLGEARAQMYDKKIPNAIERYLKKFADAEDKKKIKREIDHRVWAKVTTVNEVPSSPGKWRVSLAAKKEGHNSHSYVVRAANETEAREKAAELAKMPVWKFTIPPSVRQAIRGGVPFMQAAPAAVGAGAMMGGDRGEATQ